MRRFDSEESINTALPRYERVAVGSPTAGYRLIQTPIGMSHMQDASYLDNGLMPPLPLNLPPRQSPHLSPRDVQQHNPSPSPPHSQFSVGSSSNGVSQGFGRTMSRRSIGYSSPPPTPQLFPQSSNERAMSLSRSSSDASSSHSGLGNSPARRVSMRGRPCKSSCF